MPPSIMPDVSLTEAINRLEDRTLPDIDTFFVSQGNDVLDHLIGIQWMVRNRRLFGCPALPRGAWHGDAIAVGSGPSLDSQLHKLERLQDKMLIVAAHSAVPKLLHNGIVPHLITPKERDPDIGIIPKMLPEKVVYAGLPTVPVAPNRCHSAYLVTTCDPVHYWLGFGRDDISSPANSGSLAAWVANCMATGSLYLVGYDMTLGHYDGFSYPEEQHNGGIVCADGETRPSCVVYRQAQRELSEISEGKTVVQVNPEGGAIMGRGGRVGSLPDTAIAGWMQHVESKPEYGRFERQIRRMPDVFETAEYRVNQAKTIPDMNVDALFGDDRHLGGSILRTVYIGASILRRTVKLSDADAFDMLRGSLMNTLGCLRPVARNLIRELV